MKVIRTSSSVFVLTLALVGAGCGTLQPPDATGPRGADYPPIYTADDARRSATTSAISRLLQPPTENGTAVSLSPLTLTVESLPAGTRQPSYLPKLGTAAEMSEEETRESLRRFIGDWRDLIGADPAKLSLVQRTDQPDGTKIAIYEQRPFRYPIRGNFGKLEIRFAADRRVINLTSTCIPDADRIQNALAATAVKLKGEDAVNQIVQGGVSFSRPTGAAQTVTLAASQLRPLELVTFVRKSAATTNALEFHISWEVEVTGAALKRVYVDAVNGEVIHAE